MPPFSENPIHQENLPFLAVTPGITKEYTEGWVGGWVGVWLRLATELCNGVLVWCALGPSFNPQHHTTNKEWKGKLKLRASS